MGVELFDEQSPLKGKVLSPGGRRGSDVEGVAVEAQGSGVAGNSFAHNCRPALLQDLQLPEILPGGLRFDSLQHIIEGLKHRMGLP